MWPPCTVASGRNFQVDYFGSVYVGNTSSLIDRHILCYGAWERSTLYFLRDAAAQLDSHPSVFVDIGANTGSHSLFMSHYVDVVHAFDPYQRVLDQFERSIQTSGVENITIHAVGLGNRAARLPFQEPADENTGTGSFVPGLHENNEDRGMQLEVVVGDQYFEEVGIADVDIIKIDAEGYEKPILEGLVGTLATYRPIIVFELTSRSGSDGLFDSYESVLRVLPDEYELRMLSRQHKETGAYELVPLRIDFDADFDQEDAVALPKEKISLIRLTSPGEGG